MNGATSLLTSVKPSWILNGIFIVTIVGGFIMNDVRFRTHMADRDTAVEQRLEDIGRELIALEDDIDALRSSVAKNDIAFAKVATTVDDIKAHVDQILVEMRRP